MKTFTIQQWLFANAMFSILCAIDMLLFSELIAGWMQVSPAWSLQVLGVGLLMFAAYLVWLSRREHISKATGLQIIVCDALWVLGSIVLMVWNPWQFSMIGLAMVAGVAAVVGVFAVGQTRSLKRYCDALPSSTTAHG